MFDKGKDTQSLVLNLPHKARNPKTMLSENGCIGKIVLSARGLKEG